MVRTILVAALAATLALTLASCGGDDDDAAGDDSLTVQLQEQSESGQSGEATLTQIDDQTTRVVVELSGGPDNPQPAHIHTGSCEELGDVAYGLNDLEGGSSETEVDASLDELRNGDFAINAHQSADEIEVYTACGDVG